MKCQLHLPTHLNQHFQIHRLKHQTDQQAAELLAHLHREPQFDHPQPDQQGNAELDPK